MTTEEAFKKTDTLFDLAERIIKAIYVLGAVTVFVTGFVVLTNVGINTLRTKLDDHLREVDTRQTALRIWQSDLDRRVERLTVASENLAEVSKHQQTQLDYLIQFRK